MIFLIAFFSTFLWGVGSLFLVASKTGSVKTVLLKKPSITVGDFFILPIISGIIGNYYWQTGINNIFAGFQGWLILTISILLTIISAIRFQLLHPLWLPHLLFYTFMAFTIISFLSKFDLTTLSWWFVLTGTVVHQSLGILFPKKFPDINHNRHSGAKSSLTRRSDRI